jgi:hypothetical protein
LPFFPFFSYRYDPHLHALSDDDVYYETEGLLDPYDNIFKSNNNNGGMDYSISRFDNKFLAYLEMYKFLFVLNIIFIFTYINTKKKVFPQIL